MEIIELVIDETENIGVDAISIVENPAIESDFIALSKEPIKLATVSEEKRILMGAALIPNKHIFRRIKDKEFYIFFSKDTIVKASQMYLKNSNQSNTTLEHDKKVDNLTIVESWIVEDAINDKTAKYNLNVPIGTWMVSMKVDNDEVWNDYVKTGKVKGFSIEGYFADKIDMQEVERKEVEDLTAEEAETLFNLIVDAIKKQDL